MASAIMLQGTGSDVGKTVLVAGLCRAARNRGLEVRPFKPQTCRTTPPSPTFLATDRRRRDRPGAVAAGHRLRCCADRPHESGVAEAPERDRLADDRAGKGVRHAERATIRQ